MKPEEHLQLQVKRYMDMQYPKVLKKFNFLDGARIPIGLATKAKSLGSGRGFPDLFIFEARGGYHGLMLELKVEGTKLKNRNGIYRTPHLAEQASIINELCCEGYKACFGIGFDECKRIIDEYLKLQKN